MPPFQPCFEASKAQIEQCEFEGQCHRRALADLGGKEGGVKHHVGGRNQAQKIQLNPTQPMANLISIKLFWECFLETYGRE